MGRTLKGVERDQGRKGKKKITLGHDGTTLSNDTTTLQPEVTTFSATLEKAGISRKSASRLQQAAELPEEDFEVYIAEEKAKGEQGDITSKAVIRRAKRNEPQPKPAPVPKGKYKCLVVDPPWPITKQFRKEYPYEPELSYPTMTLEEIEELNLGKLAVP